MTELNTAATIIYEKLSPIGIPVCNGVGTQYPCIVFARLSGKDIRGAGGLRIGTDSLYLVRVIGKGGAHSDIEPYAAQIDSLLVTEPTDRDDGTVYSILREEDYEDTETDLGTVFYSRGGIYRILIH